MPLPTHVASSVATGTAPDDVGVEHRLEAEAGCGFRSTGSRTSSQRRSFSAPHSFESSAPRSAPLCISAQASAVRRAMAARSSLSRQSAGEGKISERCASRAAAGPATNQPHSSVVKVGIGVSAGITPLPAIIPTPLHDDPLPGYGDEQVDGETAGVESVDQKCDAADPDVDVRSSRRSTRSDHTPSVRPSLERCDSDAHQQPVDDEGSQVSDEDEEDDCGGSEKGVEKSFDNQSPLAGISRHTFLAAAASAGGAASSLAQHPMARDVTRRVRFSVETAVKPVQQVKVALTDLTPGDVGEMRFSGFTLFVIALFSMAFLTDMFIILTDRYAQQHNIDGVPTFPLVLNYMWMGLQLALFLDVTFAYMRYCFPSSWLRRLQRKSSVMASDDELGDEDLPEFLGSKNIKPFFWVLIVRCFRLEDFKARSYLLVMAVLLPLNTLFVYEGLGYPVLTESHLAGVDIEAFLNNATFPVGNGISMDTATWVVTVTWPFLQHVTITSQACYAYESAEFQLLSHMRNEEIAKQAYCESTVGSMMARWAEETEQASWRQDDDIWEEAFIFLVRLFGSLAGVIADQSEGDVGNRFLRDMTDVFDMYMFTFADVAQMLEGRPLLQGTHALFGSVFRRPYHRWVTIWLMLAYATILFRALGIIGWRPLVSFIKKLGSVAEEAELQVVIDATLGLLVIDLPFLTLRWVAWWFYLVPVSLMCVKNVFAIVEAFYIMGLVKGFNSRDSQAGGIWLCCKRRMEAASLSSPMIL